MGLSAGRSQGGALVAARAVAAARGAQPHKGVHEEERGGGDGQGEEDMQLRAEALDRQRQGEIWLESARC